MNDLSKLAALLDDAPGGSVGLDDLVAQVYGVPAGPYSESVDRCLELVKSVVPGWRLHVGYGVSGVLPYASLTQAGTHYEAEGPTVPLAVLRVVVKVPRP
ncbi:MAG: hypothetical protein LDL39_04805 [Magnetospirillum sp.]|nr:hypothetical protein [Magnetospirillum sp.]